MITEEMLLKARHIIKLYNEEQLIIHGVNLLPCPFCNGTAHIRTTTFGDNITDNYSVECENGHALDYWDEDVSKVMSAWNDRQ